MRHIRLISRWKNAVNFFKPEQVSKIYAKNFILVPTFDNSIITDKKELLEELFEMWDLVFMVRDKVFAKLDYSKPLNVQWNDKRVLKLIATAEEEILTKEIKKLNQAEYDKRKQLIKSHVPLQYRGEPHLYQLTKSITK